MRGLARFSKGLSVLVVDDDHGLRSVVTQVLEDDGYAVTEAASAEEALALFRDNPFPLVISDIVMEEMNGIELLGEIKKINPETQVVIMTSHASLESAVNALRAGAYDYLFKPFEDLTLISAAIKRAAEKICLGMENRGLLEQLLQKNQELEQTNLRLQLDFFELKRQEDEIQRLANYDLLTGLPNRTLFKDRLQQALGRGQRTGSMVALLFLDLDNFKVINDSFGHHCGDMLLAAVAKRLQGCVRKADTVARLGGDEYVLLLTTNQNEHEVGIVANKVLKVFGEPFYLDGSEVFVTTSIGISLSSKNETNADLMLKHADLAMYAAKRRERNSYQFFSEDLNQQAQHRQLMESGLRRALSQGEFYLVYQPQVDLRSGLMTGVEALLRWNHPERGMIPPDSFIPIAEETGLILPIAEWVLRTACSQALSWQQAGLPRMRMAVNLSGCQFRRPGLSEMVQRTLEKTGLDPQYLELELTESVLMDCADSSIKTLATLKAQGISIAIDDFGTGYSSLNYLKHFPIDRIKIDRSFVVNIGRDSDDAAIAAAIISMSSSLGLQTIAEGVETLEALEFLKDRGCYEMQGYYFSRPIPAAELTQLLSSQLKVKTLIPRRIGIKNFG